MVLLHDDIRSPAPHLCLDFVLDHATHTLVTRLAISFHDEIIGKAAISLLNELVESDEDDHLLADYDFADGLLRFVDDISELVFFHENNDEVQSEAMELLFNITAKVKLNKDLLPFWFGLMHQPEQEGVEEEEVHTSLSKPNVVSNCRVDFPLCFHLVEHAYRQDSGDFARTAILYIVDLSSKVTVLEDWITNSDVFDLLASGLGALYSQLSRCVRSSFVGLITDYLQETDPWPATWEGSFHSLSI